jgi:hypothetical protein
MPMTVLQHEHCFCAELDAFTDQLHRCRDLLRSVLNARRLARYIARLLSTLQHCGHDLLPLLLTAAATAPTCQLSVTLVLATEP